MAVYESKPVEVRTPSGIHLNVPVGETINISTQQYRDGAWVELKSALTSGDYYYTSYNIISMKLTSDTIVSGVSLRVKWYDQRTHTYNSTVPELVTAVGVD